VLAQLRHLLTLRRIAGSDFNGQNVYWGQNLQSAVNSGQVSQSRLDDMVTRILASWYLVGQDQGYPSVSWSSWNGGNGGPNVQTSAHQAVARQIASDGVVLLKNSESALPLSTSASLALIGQDAIVNPSGANACTDRGCNTGHLAMGWGSGTAEFPYLIAPYDGIKSQSSGSITLSSSDDTSSGANAAAGKDAALVFITADR
jgi:beta-glucosidase